MGGLGSHFVSPLRYQSIWNSNFVSKLVGDSILLGYDDLYFGVASIFRVVQLLLFVLVQQEVCKPLRTSGNYIIIHTASHFMRPESSSTKLWGPQISQISRVSDVALCHCDTISSCSITYARGLQRVARGALYRGPPAVLKNQLQTLGPLVVCTYIMWSDWRSGHFFQLCVHVHCTSWIAVVLCVSGKQLTILNSAV
jgi:hypothetical protein